MWRLYHATKDGRLFNYPVHLSRQERGTMSERYALEQFERDKAKREEEARKESEQQQERVTKANQKRLWISDGDTESSFEAAWPHPRPVSIYSTYNTRDT